MRMARALLVPSRCYEGLPMTIVEAMSSGTPILASRIGSLAEIIVDGVNGRLLPVGDVAAWGRAISDALDDEDATSLLGINARRLYEEIYDEESGYRSIIKIYESAIQRSKAPNSEFDG